MDGVPLTFSDLCPLPDGRLLFAAVAETGESTYQDGECVADGLDLLLVADADDPAVAAPLLAASVAL